MSRRSHPALSEAVERCSALSEEIRTIASGDACATAAEALSLRRLANLLDRAVRLWAAGFEAMRPQGLPVTVGVVGRARR